jgi:hypothetical protein
MMAEGSQQDQLSFAVGDFFSTFDELEAKVKAYENAQFMKFWKRDSRTIEAAKKRLNKFLKPELKYYELKYCCIHGGQAFKAKGKGSRSTS